MKIATQNQAFFPTTIMENSNISKRWDLMAMKLMADCWLNISTK